MLRPSIAVVLTAGLVWATQGPALAGQRVAELPAAAPAELPTLQPRTFALHPADAWVGHHDAIAASAPTLGAEMSHHPVSQSPSLPRRSYAGFTPAWVATVGAATDGATGATFEPATAGGTKRAGKAAGRDAPGAADPPAANGVGTGQDSQPVGVQPAQPKAVAAWTTLVPPYSDASPLPAQGRAMYYNPGVMAEVLAYRLNLGHVTPCPECIGYAALLRSGDINRKVWIQWPDGVVDGPYLVVDVAAKQHVGTLLARNWVVDVDHETAARRGMNQPLAVTVLAGPAAQ